MSNQIKNHVLSMMDQYRESGSFTKESVNTLLELADFSSYEVSKMINKFYYINTHIAENGGVPVLKKVIALLELEN